MMKWNIQQRAAIILGIIAVAVFVAFGIFPDVLFPYSGPTGIDYIGQALGHLIIIGSIAMGVPIILAFVSIILIIISRKKYGKNKKNIFALIPILIIVCIIAYVFISKWVAEVRYSDEHSVDRVQVQGNEVSISDRNFRYEVVFDANNNEIRVDNETIILNKEFLRIDVNQSAHIEFEDNIVSTWSNVSPLPNDLAMVKYRGEDGGPIICIFDNDAQYNYYNTEDTWPLGYNEGAYLQYNCLVESDNYEIDTDTMEGKVIFYKDMREWHSPKNDYLYVKLSNGGCVLIIGDKVSPLLVLLESEL